MGYLFCVINYDRRFLSPKFEIRFLKENKMKYPQIDSALFVANRKDYTKQLKPKSLAIFNSNDIFPISADSSMPFKQHRDIFYPSGVDQEESILVLFPDSSDEAHREVLFLTETSPKICSLVWCKIRQRPSF